MNPAFNHLALEYDDWFIQNEMAYRPELAAVKAILPPGGRSLKIGVGTGRLPAPLGIEGGVEPSKAMAAIARKRGIKVLEASEGPGILGRLPNDPGRSAAGEILHKPRPGLGVG